MSEGEYKWLNDYVRKRQEEIDKQSEKQKGQSKPKIKLTISDFVREAIKTQVEMIAFQKLVSDESPFMKFAEIRAARLAMTKAEEEIKRQMENQIDKNDIIPNDLRIQMERFGTDIGKTLEDFNKGVKPRGRPPKSAKDVKQ